MDQKRRIPLPPRPGSRSVPELDYSVWNFRSSGQYDLPRRTSKRVRDAMTFLLDLTQKAIGEEYGTERHRMAVDAAAYLFRAFPMQEAPLPGLPQAGSGGVGGSASGIPVPGAPGGEGEQEQGVGGAAPKSVRRKRKKKTRGMRSPLGLVGMARRSRAAMERAR